MASLVKVDARNFDAIYEGFLRRESDPRITRAMWGRLLHNAWNADEGHCGYALADGDAIVGFFGYLFSRRRVRGELHKFCNLTTFVVNEPYRNQSLVLLSPLASMRDYTIFNLTPSPDVYKIFKAFGFRHLETRVNALLPLPGASLPLGRARVTFDPRRIEERLTGDAHETFEQHRDYDCGHMLVEGGDGSCYAIYTRRRYRRIPFVHIHYVSDPAVLARHVDAFRLRLMARAACPLVFIDERFMGGQTVARSISRSYPSPLLFRSPRLAPADVPNVYSELVIFPI